MRTFDDACKKSSRQVLDLQLGEKLTLDGVEIRVLGIRNPEIKVNPINNQCLVLRFEDSNRAILFLADLGEQAGDKLLKSKYAKYLKADYCQMAHHGQRGVNEAFYHEVQPKYCLWTAPKWLWDNDSGGGKGSGHWKTLETRGWMEKMDIQKHYVICDGLQEIR
jgi:beta-lactamase superfamily II metal-dependent hydrolase